MQINQTKHLFQLQTELVDMKVDMAVNKAIQQVVKQITDLRSEMQAQMGSLREEIHDLRHEMRDRFSSLENRVMALETHLGWSTHTKQQVRSKLIDYGFRAIWVVLTAAFALLILQFQILIK